MSVAPSRLDVGPFGPGLRPPVSGVDEHVELVAVDGGDLGYAGPGVYDPAFEKALYALEEGQVSAPVRTDFGWHLILVSETRVAKQPTLDDLRDELAQGIEQKAVEEHIKSLTDAAKIEKPGEAIDPALLGDVTLLDK